MSSFDTLAPHELAREMVVRGGARTGMFWGTKGTGKTSLAIKFAREVSPHVIKVTLNDGDMAAKYEGFYQPDGDRAFKFVRGLFAEAWTWENKGCPIIVDEVDRASSEVLSLMYGFLDDPLVAQLTLPDGATITPGPDFRCFMTSNQPPSAIPEPLADRSEFIVQFTRPSPEMIATLHDDVAAVAEYLMTEHMGGRKPMSFRDLAHFCRFRRKVGDNVAAQACFGPQWSDVLTVIKGAAAV